MKHIDMAGFTYVPGRFASVASTEEGRAVLKWLTQNVISVRLTAVADLRCVSVAVIQQDLLDEFGDTVRAYRMRQYVGHIVRQVMSYCGYELEKEDVKLIRPILFKTGARYKERQGVRRLPLSR